MDSQSIATHAAVEENYWWFVGRRAVIRRLASRYFPTDDRRILDWGCGAGGNYNLLTKFGSVLGVDSSEVSIEFCRSRNITSVQKISSIDDLHVPEQFDLLTNFDVLEHLEDDEYFLRGAHRVLKPGGYVLITVPAYMFLWSQLDDILGHVRRYSRRQLIKKVEKCGFTVLRASYFITILSPLFILVRLVQRRNKKAAKLEDLVVPLPAPINRIFSLLVALEAVLIRWVNLPFGTSIILLGKRNTL